jgi:M6 family metalloprotease-like protein
MWESQLLVDRFESAQLFQPSDDLRWFKTHAEIYLFLGRQIPSFLADYRAQIETLENQAIKIINERGQQIIIGRATGPFVLEYYESFINLVKTGFEGLVDLRLLPPEGFDFPQPKIVSSDVCYMADLRGPVYPSMRPQDTTVTHQIPSERVSSNGEKVGLSVLIGFNEYPSTLSDAEYLALVTYANDVSYNYFYEMSEGQLSFEWRYHPEIITMPFFLSPEVGPGSPNYEAIINQHIEDVLAILEETTDLTDVDLINFFWSAGLPSYVYGGISVHSDEPLNTQRGEIFNYSVKLISDNYIYNNDLLAVSLYHGIAHNLGLTDIYVHQGIPEFAGKPTTYKYGHWDLMTSASNELNAWHRWILGWMQDEQVHCIPTTQNQEYQVFLEPLNRSDADIRHIVIRLSETEALSIEVRGPGTFCTEELTPRYFYDFPGGGCTSDVLVTHIDGMVGNGNGPMQILRPSRSTKDDYSDALLLEGEFVTYQNITITHSQKHSIGSVITITFE